MNDLRILRVQVIKRIEQLIRPRQNLIRRKRAPLASHHLRQIVAGDELHHEKLSIAFRKMVADTRQRRMMQTSEQPCFTFELLPQALLGKQRLFERDCCIETLVDSLINRTHPALPKLANDAIATLKNCLRRKHSGDYTRATLDCGGLAPLWPRSSATDIKAAPDCRTPRRRPQPSSGILNG